MKRGGPLKRKAPMARGIAQLKRTRLKPVSDKRRAAAPERAEVREQVFARDRHRCRLDGAADVAGACRGPLTPHHLKKASAGGEYTLTNLVTLCAGHNTWVEDEPVKATELGMVIR